MRIANMTYCALPEAAAFCACRYNERLVIDKRVSIAADGSGPVTLSWSTSEPYQSAIESRGTLGARVSGLTIQHRSPSVANNYAVFLQVGPCICVDHFTATDFVLAQLSADLYRLVDLQWLGSIISKFQIYPVYFIVPLVRPGSEQQYSSICCCSTGQRSVVG